MAASTSDHATRPRNSQLTAHHTHQHLSSLFTKTSLTTGPFSFLNPTRAHFHHLREGDDEQLAENVEFQWRSRDNRKGRHTLNVKPATSAATANYVTPESTSTWRGLAKGIWRMCTQYPYWDVSWLVAVIFTLGSVVWVFNAFFVFLPTLVPSSEFSTEIVYGGGITAFIGATIFEIGSVLLMVEAVNENRTGCFGWAFERVFEGEKGETIQIKPDTAGCRHHHQNKKNLVGKGDISDTPDPGKVAKTQSASSTTADEADSKQDQGDEGRANWVWFPSWHDLTTHYFREIGFLACLSQFFGATVFWISGFTALPNLINPTNTGLEYGVYWTPQVIGGMGFVVSGVLFMLETQKKWYLPAWGTLGWHIGLWNLIGALGFTLCGAFGFSPNTGLQYQAACSTFWGSWAFLIASVVQWYESLDKNPVHVDKAPSPGSNAGQESL
ncbi:hypothetical protein HWV62_35214 [Athelia sp. TMB]|nr:hypothetical protein HWV62_35214 [Athelia sp. TMB]